MDVLEKMKQEIPKLTKLQRKAADFIINNPMQAAFSTVDQLAHSVNTSTTTIVRLSLFLGYSGYTQFQKDLQDMLTSQNNPADKLTFNLKVHPEKNDLIKSIINGQMNNFSKTVDNLSDELILKTEQLLSSANHIFVMGQRSCFSIAHYLSFNLDRIYGKSELLATEGGELYERIHRMEKGDVLIAVSMSRYIEAVYKTAEFAKQRGVSVISITDSYLSPLSPCSDVLFLAECHSLDFHNSIISGILMAEILIGVCAMNNLNLVQEHLEESEKVLTLFGVHMKK